MSKLKINDLELYQAEDIDSHKVQGGFSRYYFSYHFDHFTFNQYPVYLHADVEETSYQEPKPTSENYQLAVYDLAGNSFASATVGKIGDMNYATSRSSSSLY
ncbi:hypothetical protein [Mastigocoleus sp. MO_188.B34]|uniref:hypothetical protein n=1 Tax=Mastigocoleus sp. MO_188.B34 TaxID=3036635 RepID=UPI00260F4C24|nr:hypothetical protein [Mastigocoleus sp. MO_188.B34]MDJ0696523.1 hypothetical protein [Mastigocoleus sp. MO_188.B34]